MKSRYVVARNFEEGQPDKLCDTIADDICREITDLDGEAKVDVNVSITKDTVFISGEVSSRSNIEYERLVRNTLRAIGYTDSSSGIDPYRCEVIVKIQKQSQDISRGINSTTGNKGIKANDQGTIWGYATSESQNLIPMPYNLASELSSRLTFVRKKNVISSLLPDGQVQVCMEYKEDIPDRIDSIVLTAHHLADTDLEWLRMEIIENVINPVCTDQRLLDLGMTDKESWVDEETKFLINTSGRFIIGGPLADCGCSGVLGEKESYGGIVHYSGYCGVGKDISKINKCAKLMADIVAREVVSKMMADRCEIAVSYAIGVADPVCIEIDTYGTANTDEELILDYINTNFNFKPGDIMSYLKRHPQ